MVAQTNFAGSGFQEKRTGDARVGSGTAVTGLLSSSRTSCVVMPLGWRIGTPTIPGFPGVNVAPSLLHCSQSGQPEAREHYNQ